MKFSAAFADLHLLRHPFYQAWMEGKLSLGTLREYAIQYAFHVDAFPRYLSSLHSLCDDPQERRQLLQNLNEEEGVGYDSSHPELWRDFASGLGVDPTDADSAKPCRSIQKVTETFFRLSRASYEEGLGALYAYESQVPEVAESKIAGLKERYGIDSKKTLAFFEVHRAADIEHREVVQDMLEKLPTEKKQRAQVAAHEAAQALWDFLSEMKERNDVAC